MAKPDPALKLEKQTMIIDDVFAGCGLGTKWMDRQDFQRLAATALRADRFVFSRSASRLIGQFCMECSDLIVQHRQFAIPPFDNMYIELKEPFFESFPPEPLGARGSDIEIGYWVVGKRVYGFSRGVKDKARDDATRSKADIVAVFSPLYYTWVPPGEHAPLDNTNHGRPIIISGKNADWNHIALGIGRGVHTVKDEETRQSLLREFQPHLEKGFASALHQMYDGDQVAIQQHVQEMAMGTAGDIRNLWSALLWLNRPTHVTYSNQPAGRRFVRGKLVAYKAHRIVEIDLHKRKTLRRAFVLSGERLSPRRHKVRGAFHHHGGELGCSHDWPVLPDEDGIWTCTKCRRRRWWVKNHVRGDATRGWVDHDYEATV